MSSILDLPFIPACDADALPKLAILIGLIGQVCNTPFGGILSWSWIWNVSSTLDAVVRNTPTNYAENGQHVSAEDFTCEVDIIST